MDGWTVSSARTKRWDNRKTAVTPWEAGKNLVKN